MPSAHEILQQLKIDDYDALKNKLSIAIDNIAYIPFRVKTKKELDAIDLSSNIGKLDLAVLACVLYQRQLFADKIQMQDSALDVNDYLKPILSHPIFTSIFNEERDFDCISTADAQLPDNTISQQPTSLEQMTTYAKILAVHTKTEINTVLDALATEPHCVATFALINRTQRQVVLGLQETASRIGAQVANLAAEVDAAALRRVQSVLFHSVHTAGVKRNHPDTDDSDWQPPLP